jgi:SAM-dependent methyltransferase
MRTPAELALCDIDDPAVTWVSQHLAAVDARVSAGLPPLPFDRDSFDLVLCFSVFTHLDEAYQNAWLAELHRVTKPGGVVIATVHGECSWHAHAHWAQMSPLEHEFRHYGFLYRKDDGWGDYFPDFYHTAFHQPFYVRARWSRWFDVVGIVPGRLGGEHDFVILCRRWTPTRVRARARARAGALKRRVRARAGKAKRALRPARHQ